MRVTYSSQYRAMVVSQVGAGPDTQHVPFAGNVHPEDDIDRVVRDLPIADLDIDSVDENDGIHLLVSSGHCEWFLFSVPLLHHLIRGAIPETKSWPIVKLFSYFGQLLIGELG